MVNFVFHLKSDEGHIERFSFDVYMSPLPIFAKIKHPFAWHISFLVRHLGKYSDASNISSFPRTDTEQSPTMKKSFA